MPDRKLARFLILPELKLRAVYKQGRASALFVAEKKRPIHEVCPKCANPSSTFYDRRVVKLRDAPIYGSSVYLKVIKRRYFCKSCKKPFTEPLAGVMPKRRTTQRYRRSLLWACENFSDLSKVRKAYRCSSQLLYTVFYEQLARFSRNLDQVQVRKHHIRLNLS
jgi:transposase